MPTVLQPEAIFDLGLRKFYQVNGPAGHADRIERYLNDVPILWAIEQNAASFVVPNGTVINFWVKQNLNDPATLTEATTTLIADAEEISVGEDYTLAGLVALFAGSNLRFVDLWCQLELQLPDDPAGTSRKATIPFRLWNDLSAAGTGATGSAPSVFKQTKPYTALTGGIAGALDFYPTVNLATDTWIASVVRDVDGSLSESRWILVDGDDAEDTDTGVVRPDDYADVTNEKVWKRVSGL